MPKNQTDDYDVMQDIVVRAGIRDAMIADMAKALAVHHFNLTNTTMKAAPMDELRAAIEKVIMAERERCAKIATSFGIPGSSDIAEAILDPEEHP